MYTIIIWICTLLTINLTFFAFKTYIVNICIFRTSIFGIQILNFYTIIIYLDVFWWTIFDTKIILDYKGAFICTCIICEFICWTYIHTMIILNFIDAIINTFILINIFLASFNTFTIQFII